MRRLSLGWVLALLTMAAVAARAEDADFGPAGVLPNIVRFTTIEATQLTERLFWQRRQETTAGGVWAGTLLPGLHDLCAFDRPDGLSIQHLTALNNATVTAPDFVSRNTASVNVRAAAADRRLTKIAELFPQWAVMAGNVRLAHYWASAGDGIAGGTVPRGVYIAFGKIVGRSAGFDGIAGNEDDQPIYVNNGDYVLERDGTNTKGYLPVAICALVRTPNPW